MTEPRYIEKVPHETVQQNDRESSPSPRPPPAPRRRTKWEKLGRYNISVLAIGTVVILTAIGFLAFVWFISIKKSRAELVPPLWLSIVHNDWTSRVVTLATMLVRIAVAAQLCVFAALMAALILERAGTSTEDLPLLSMIRCANTGPQALIWNVMHTIPKGIQLGYSFIIIVTILNALALQFISTLLLADFSNDYVLSAPKTNYTDLSSSLYPVKYAIEDKTQNLGTSIKGNNFWQSSQSSFPSFAEYKHNATKGATFQDTGLTYRGFLPTTNATLRANLMNYAGPMTVVDERVVCVKPELSNVFVSIPKLTRNTVSGEFVFNSTHPDVIQYPDSQGFNCSMSNQPYAADVYWQLSLCQLGGMVGGLRSGIQPQVYWGLDSVTGEAMFGDSALATTAWLFLNATSPADFNYTQMPANADGTIQIPLTQLETPKGPWAKAGHANVTLDVTLCLLTPITDVYTVRASSTWGTNSGDKDLYWNASKYDTFGTRAMFGALGPADLFEFYALTEGGTSISEELHTPEFRGVLSLNPVADWNSTRAALKYNTTYFEYQNNLMLSLDKARDDERMDENRNDTFLLIPSEESYTIHRSLLWIVLDVLTYTRDPALALQSLAHSVMSNAYYDYFNNFDLETYDPLYVEVETRYLPVIWKHFTVVLALLGLHAILILIALVLFLTRTELSLLGNSWQAVAQVMSEDTAEAMHHGTMATDHEVRDSVKRNGTAGHRIRIARSEHNGRLEAVSIIRRS